MFETHNSTNQTLFFLGFDMDLAQELETPLARKGLSMRSFRTVAGMMIGANGSSARVLIVETDALAPGRQPEQLVERLRLVTGLKPALVRLGGHGAVEDVQHVHFDRPFEVSRIVGKLIEMAATPIPPQYRVLLVGESPLENADNAQALLEGGIRVKAVCDEASIESAVESFAPQLAVVDLDMVLTAEKTPSARIRDCPGCQDLPIVFLSSDSIQTDRVQVRRIGGDDYLAKPVSSGQLLGTVEARLSLPPESGIALSPGTLVLSKVHFLQRLYQEITDWPNGGHGQAILYIQPDQWQTSGSSGSSGNSASFRQYLIERLNALVEPGDRGAWLSEQGFALWVSRSDDQALNAFAERVMDNIRSGLRSLRLQHRGSRSELSVSVGVGHFIPAADNAQTIISRAQAAHVQAVAAAGDRVQVYHCLMDDLPADPNAGPGTDPSDAVLVPLLRRALEGQGFQLVYQPIMPLRQVADQRYEVLLRLRTPQGAIIPPLAFLPAAERHDLLPALDRWVLSGALNMLRQERDEGRSTRFLIHQTLASLTTPDWLDWIRGEILRLDLIRQRPILEFSAQSILADEDHARILFPELAKFGIEVCLSGATVNEQMLGLLARRPIACVKLAHEMVSKREGVRLKAAVEAYHRRGARIIAAGIEDPETVGRVWSSGVDYIQGNFIQFPEPTLHFDFHHAPTL